MLRSFESIVTRISKMADSNIPEVITKTAATLALPPTTPLPIPPRGVDYRNKVVLAPMVRSGELPTRLLALRYGADLVWGPETIDRSMIGTTRRECARTGTVTWSRLSTNNRKNLAAEDHRESILYRLHPQKEGSRLIFQMGTADPLTAVQCARLVAADVAGIDVNSGCPKPFSTSGGMGAALLKTPDKLVAILEALVKEIVPEFGIGISVKIRILDKPEDTEALVRRIVKTGITGLTVHCRTTPMRPRERAIRGQLRMIRDVCREAGVACVMNGDVYSREEALELMKEYGVDGAMIATAAEKNPSVFRSHADGGKVPFQQLVRELVEVAFSVENRWANTKFMLSQFIPGKSPLYQAVSMAKKHEDLAKALGFDDLVDKAKELDLLMGFTKNDLKRQAETPEDSFKRVKTENNVTSIDNVGEQAISAIAV